MLLRSSWNFLIDGVYMLKVAGAPIRDCIGFHKYSSIKVCNCVSFKLHYFLK